MAKKVRGRGNRASGTGVSAREREAAMERERRSTAVGISPGAGESTREGKRGENKLKAKLYSHKKMELFLDAVPARYEEKEGWRRRRRWRRRWRAEGEAGQGG